jgi:hypothetical protein
MAINSGLSFDQPLTDVEQASLRSRGVLQTEEVAVRAGDLLVAVNTLTGVRRAITNENIVTEAPQRRILRD